MVLLSGNPDLDVRGLDEATWRSYVAAKSQGTVPLLRLVLLGEERAGKTSLLRAIMHQKVDVTQEQRTTGIESCVLSDFTPDKGKVARSIKEVLKKRNSASISMECFDFGGPEIS